MKVQYLDGPDAVEHPEVTEEVIQRGEPADVSDAVGKQLIAQGWIPANLEVSEEAQELAREHPHVNLGELASSGKVSASDVREHLEAVKQAVDPAPAEVNFASDEAAELAEKEDVDPSAITGSGKGGAITVKDVRAAKGGEG